MKDIESREDVLKLVETFYEKVRSNEEIGHFFNKTITDWPPHIQKLTDFWEANLFFGKSNYRGNPMEVHKKVDQNFDHVISQTHFGAWINMWHGTIDELFEGEIANRAKQRARNMANMLFMNIYAARTKE